MVENGSMKATVGYKIWAKMDKEEQEKFFNEIGRERIKTMTQKATKEYIEKVKLEENEELIKAKTDLKNTEDRLSKADTEIETLKGKILLCQEQLSQKEIEYIEDPKMYTRT